MFVVYQIGKAAPFLRVSTPMLVQTGLAVGITTVMALLLSDNTISTMSSVWTWGTAIAVAVLCSPQVWWPVLAKHTQCAHADRRD